MTAFISTLTLGFFAAIIAAFLQHRSWKYRSQEELRQREYGEAMAVVEKLGNAVDKRLIAERRFHSLVNRHAATEEAFREYLIAVDEWMGQFSSLKTKLYLFFGRTSSLHFEEVIHRGLRDASAIIIRTFDYGLENLNTRDQKEHLLVRNNLSNTQYQAFKFINKLNDEIVDNKIGTIQYIDDLGGYDINKISRTYLILRLFGIKS